MLSNLLVLYGPLTNGTGGDYYSYLTRYYRSTTGQTSAVWLFNTIKTLGAENPAIVVTQFSHTASGFNQPSIIARIPGTSTATSKSFDIVVRMV